LSERDYYEVLGVPRTASQQEIKSSYRKLAVRYHPDRNAGDKEAEAKFKEAAEAYAALSDPEKRERYDRFGHRGVGGGFSGFDPDVFGDFSDILGDFFGFGDLFGGRRRRGEGEPGSDLRYELHLSLEEAAFGSEKNLEIPRLESCARCSGLGTRGGTPPPTCQACGGLGRVRFTQGFFTVARACPQCRGEGTLVTDPCAECRGSGRVEQRRRIEVKIPAGVDTGTRLRLSGEGEHGRRGGRTGDLYVDVVVEPHPALERRGNEILSAVDLTYAQVVLGTSVEIATLHGPHDLDIPAGTQPGAQFQLRGKGVPRLGRSGRGDHLVIVRVAVPNPRDLSEDHLERVRALAEAEGSVVKSERGVLGRVKDLFG
jgi:molecular chaperone DnaJ